jgi:hypothetical protein
MKFSKLIFLSLGVLFSASALSDIAGNETELINKVKLNFGYPGMETSWFVNIQSISSEGGKLFIKTNTNDKAKLERICGAVSALYSDKVGWDKLMVKTYAQDNSLLLRKGIEPCQHKKRD